MPSISSCATSQNTPLCSVRSGSSRTTAPSSVTGAIMFITSAIFFSAICRNPPARNRFLPEHHILHRPRFLRHLYYGGDGRVPAAPPLTCLRVGRPIVWGLWRKSQHNHVRSLSEGALSSVFADSAHYPPLCGFPGLHAGCSTFLSSIPEFPGLGCRGSSKDFL